MRVLVTGLVSAALLVSLAGIASAHSKRHRYVKTYDTARHYDRYRDRDPQRDARTFDSSKYYERDSTRIPFGTAAWWDQKTREGGGRN